MNGSIYRTTDAGTSWTSISGDLGAVATGHLTVDPTNADIVYVTTDHGIYKTLNGGGSYSLITKGLMGSMITSAVAVEQANPQHLYVSLNNRTDGFVVRLSPSGSLAFSTLVGDRHIDEAWVPGTSVVYLPGWIWKGRIPALERVQWV
jgi:photosystem II stability/assembly factor-like uncharacterized protein